MTRKRTTHRRTCNLCESMCGVEVEIEGKEIISVRGDKNDVFSRGHVCPKATALKDLYDDPDRLKQPVRRVGDRWEPMSWDDAFREVADRIHQIQQDHGPNDGGDQRPDQTPKVHPHQVEEKAADKGPNHTDDQVTDQAKALSLHQLSGQPTCNQPDDQE